MEIRLLDNHPIFDDLPVIDDPKLKTELMFMSEWEVLDDGFYIMTIVRKGDKTYILDMKEGANA